MTYDYTIPKSITVSIVLFVTPLATRACFPEYYFHVEGIIAPLMCQSKHSFICGSFSFQTTHFHI